MLESVTMEGYRYYVKQFTCQKYENNDIILIDANENCRPILHIHQLFKLPVSL